MGEKVCSVLSPLSACQEQAWLPSETQGLLGRRWCEKEEDKCRKASLVFRTLRRFGKRGIVWGREVEGNYTWELLTTHFM
jgi:hypothetical protein